MGCWIVNTVILLKLGWITLFWGNKRLQLCVIYVSFIQSQNNPRNSRNHPQGNQRVCKTVRIQIKDQDHFWYIDLWRKLRSRPSWPSVWVHHCNPSDSTPQTPGRILQKPEALPPPEKKKINSLHLKQLINS